MYRPYSGSPADSRPSQDVESQLRGLSQDFATSFNTGNYDQAERDHESKKLIILLNRVKKQIAAREDGTQSVESPKRPVAVLSGDFGSSRLPSRSAPFER